MKPKEYVKEAKTAPVADNKVFQNLLSEGLRLTGMSLRDAAREFKTAPGTISRWVNGHSAPALMARAAIIKVMRSRVNRIGRPIHGRSRSASVETKARLERVGG